MFVRLQWHHGLKNVLATNIVIEVRTQRNLVRTQRGMVYKYKCALNESALNEVRTQRGIAVLGKVS